MLDFDHCWQALCNRDPSFDGRFVFAVHSTHIFLPSQLPGTSSPSGRVSAFFRHIHEAEAAGFRACRRCSPRGKSLAEQLDELVVAACRLLDESVEPMTLDQLAARIGLSSSHLARAFKHEPA
jgi:AraC family transcriptional regulator, regulatory protein of adaptative response / methylated-DNA-[protein]-cysteine methyltransferase